MSESIIIARRFNGPPNSGNGGYSCGLIAGFIDGPATASLKAPPPLDTLLEVEWDGDAAQLTHKGAVIAVARPTPTPRIEPPAAISLAAAEAAAGYEKPEEHVFPSCFVCGPARAEGDGLRIFAGAVDGADMVAAPWRPDANLAAADGLVAAEHVWAALDCPSYFALRRPRLPALLGSMTAAIDRRPSPSETYAVLAWPLRSERRKHFAAAALVDSGGVVMARAETVWIELSPEAIARLS